MKKTMIVLLVLLISIITSCSSPDSEGTGITEDSIYIDVNQFSRITEEELIEIMGEPKAKNEWNNTTERGEFLIEILEYDGYDFFIADDSVVRMNIYSDKYYNFDKEGIKFTSEEGIFQMLNIPVNQGKIKRTVDTGHSLRYSPVSDKVADVWCIGIDEEVNSIEEIKVTFNLNYF